MDKKVLGVILTVVILALAGLGFYLSKKPHKTIAPAIEPDTSTISVYKNDTYQFLIQYDKQYQLDTNSGLPSYLGSGAVTLASISIPQSLYPKTNFGSATSTISVKKNSSSAECSSGLDNADKPMKFTGTANFNNNSFATESFSGAAAGTRYDTTVYHILRNQTCYEIVNTIGIANIGNYPAGTVTEVDKMNVTRRLNQLLNTFRLFDATSGSSMDPGTIAGHVDIGPNCPVQHVGQVCPPPAGAYDSVHILVFDSDARSVLQTLSVDSSGNYTTGVTSGTYYVDFRREGYRFPTNPKKIIVTAGKTTTQNFFIDTGIR